MTYEEEHRLRLAAEDELARLREAEAICLKYHSARARVMQENARLREQLEDATEMLTWAYQWVDPHKHVAIDIAEFLRARAALKETEERSRVIFERDAYEGSGA